MAEYVITLDDVQERALALRLADYDPVIWITNLVVDQITQQITQVRATDDQAIVAAVRSDPTLLNTVLSRVGTKLAPPIAEETV